MAEDAISEVPADRWDIDAYYDPDPDAPGKMSTPVGWVPGKYGQSSMRISFGFRHVKWKKWIRSSVFFWKSPGKHWRQPDNHRIGFLAVKRGSSSAFQLMTIYSFSHACRVLMQIDAYFTTGWSPSVASGRLSYFLGLQGASITIDTACSSSLVAVHLACQSLRNKECNLALVGGVNAILSPELNINFSKAHMMASDGRCKTFDASADGYVRSEGCGIVALKRFSDSRASGDNILALIRGSAINQDGRSSGLTVPNGPAQQDVIRKALANAGVQPWQVQYVEAHGTGTSLGDPIEIQALTAVMGDHRSQDTPSVCGHGED